MNRTSPTVTSISLADRTIHVLRDDLLAGGTKERAVLPYLSHLMRDRFEDFVYASPFCGFAQVALAAAAAKLGTRCHLFCGADETKAPQIVEHEFTRLAASFGARITLLPDLASAQAAADAFAQENQRRYLVPLGFADEQFRQLMAEEIRWVWGEIVSQLGARPRRVWLPVGSGTLTHCFDAFRPRDVELICVNVRVLDRDDMRLRKLESLPNARLLDAVEAFSQPAQGGPPLPSNIHYDAKLWRFIQEQGQDGDLWWNVAR